MNPLDIEKLSLEEIIKSDIGLSISYNTLTKEDLKVTLKHFNINFRSNDKKLDMYYFFLDWVIRNKEDFVKKISYSTIEYIEKYSCSEKTIEEESSGEFFSIREELKYFALFGFVYSKSDERVIVPSDFMCSIVKEVAKNKELRREIKENSRNVKLYFGIIRYYGYIDYENFEIIWEKITNLPFDRFMLTYLRFLPYYRNTVSVYVNNRIFYYSKEFHEIYCEVIEGRCAEISNRNDIKHKILKADEYIKYGTLYFYESTKEIRNLKKEYYKKYSDKNIVEEVVRITLNALRFAGHIGEVIQWLTDDGIVTEDNIFTLTNIYVELWNNLPQYALKGYSSVELRKMLSKNK